MVFYGVRYLMVSLGFRFIVYVGIGVSCGSRRVVDGF